MGASQDIEEFLKTRVTKGYVEREQKQRLASGALQCEIKETETEWVLTTLWPAF
ncbi:MAG: hypothetical protein P4L57_12930 [Rhizomicrobium sp.]|nr:hypothetical protein [Rhizomicrobium sp.]